MLAVETRASAAVGVGISVTTIPASAFIGAAVGTGEFAKTFGCARDSAPNEKPRGSGAFLVRGGRTRTCNPRFWRPVLCQLSYAPRFAVGLYSGG
jgi:hypothetical protein